MSGMIIGAGIGGLATAIALQKRGVPVRVFEAASALSPIGAGILVPPNAMNILARYGLAEQVRAAGKPIDRFAILDRHGKLISQVSAHYAQQGSSHQAVAIHRGQLQQVLLNGLMADTIATKKSCVRINLPADRTEALFVDGTTVSGAFVVGADGLHSVVRHAVFPQNRLRYSGQTCWRGVATLTLADKWANQFVEIWDRCGAFGFVPISASQVYWFATQRAPAYGVDDMHDVKQCLIDLHGSLIEPVVELIAQTETSQIIRNDLFDLVRLKSWTKGRAVLIGDAAHAMLPNLGQGGAQAIEDSWVLSEALATTKSYEEAFIRFQSLRLARARKIAGMSRDLANISGLCNATLRNVRDTLLRRTPAFITAYQSRSIYGMPYFL